MALFPTALGLYGGVLWSGELQGFIIHQMMPTAIRHRTTQHTGHRTQDTGHDSRGSAASLAQAAVSRTDPPVCIPLASAIQRPLTAHVKPGLCVVFLAIGAFQRHSSQHALH
jgi:hypothetical protein